MTPIAKPSVLVGIATHNRAELLPKAICSALAQTYQPIHVALIDDASTDETPSLRSEFPQLAWERWQQNRGYVRARNKMMLEAVEDYYVSLDDDAWFLENDEIAIAVEYLERYANVAAIAFDILSPQEPDRRPRGAKSSVALFIGCGHVLRLSAVRQMGGYTVFPGTYGFEEKDLCLRLLDAGFAVVKLDGVHVWHEKTATARDLSRQHRSGVRNDLTLTAWRFPGRMLGQALAWKVFSHLSFAVRHRVLRSCVQGISDFARGFASVWRGRNPVRPSTVAHYRALERFPREISD